MSKRLISLIILGVLLTSYIGYIIWKKVDMGAVTIIVPAPFTFMFDSSDMITCTSGRCILTLPSGNHDVLITKSGYENFLAQVNIERGKNVEFKPSLQRILSAEVRPSVTFSLPQIEDIFALKTDASGKMALIKKAPKSSAPDEVIAYFARPLIAPLIATDKLGLFVWIADTKQSTDDIAEKSIYAVNTKEKTRKVVFSTGEKIQAVVPSPWGASALVILPSEVHVIKNDGSAITKIRIAGLTEKTILWGENESTLYLVQHTSSEDTLSRAQLDSNNGLVQTKKMEEISKWKNEVDTIQFLYFDEKQQELRIQGKNKAYGIKL